MKSALVLLLLSLVFVSCRRADFLRVRAGYSAAAAADGAGAGGDDEDYINSSDELEDEDIDIDNDGEGGSSRTQLGADTDAEQQQQGDEETVAALSAPDYNINVGSKAAAGKQFMITVKMRSTLVNELGYLPKEVDIMEPQIAAVVIERGLQRPPDGMPATWSRPADQVKSLDKKGSSGKKSGAMKGVVASLKKHLPLMGATSLGIFALVTNRMLLVKIGTAVLSKVGLSRGGSKKSKKALVSLSTAEELTSAEGADSTAAPEAPVTKPKRKSRGLKIRKMDDYTTRASGFTKKRVKPKKPDAFQGMKDLMKKVDLGALSDVQNEGLNKLKNFKFGKSS